MTDEFVISLAHGPADMSIVRTLFSAYQEWLGGDVCFQGFQSELDGLPGPYAAPQGCLLLARQGTEVVGVVGIRPVAGSDAETRCEMKRLYVLPDARGRGLGRYLTLASMEHAHKAGYKYMILETLLELEAARSLYRSLGFAEISDSADPCTDKPILMERELVHA